MSRYRIGVESRGLMIVVSSKNWGPTIRYTVVRSLSKAWNVSKTPSLLAFANTSKTCPSLSFHRVGSPVFKRRICGLVSYLIENRLGEFEILISSPGVFAFRSLREK